MYRRYPEVGDKQFAAGKAGENILAPLGAKNVRWFNLVTKKNVPVQDNIGRVHIGQFREATQTYAYVGGGKVTTPSEERGSVDALVLGAATEYYIEFETFHREAF